MHNGASVRSGQQQDFTAHLSTTAAKRHSRDHPKQTWTKRHRHTEDRDTRGVVVNRNSSGTRHSQQTLFLPHPSRRPATERCPADNHIGSITPVPHTGAHHPSATPRCPHCLLPLCIADHSRRDQNTWPTSTPRPRTCDSRPRRCHPQSECWCSSLTQGCWGRTGRWRCSPSISLGHPPQ